MDCSIPATVEGTLTLESRSATPIFHTNPSLCRMRYCCGVYDFDGVGRQQDEWAVCRRRSLSGSHMLGSDRREVLHDDSAFSLVSRADSGSG